jgi:hypothetical protein
MTTTETSQAQLVYEFDELMQDHEFAAPHVIDGQRLHGGFMANGNYQPPRALVREAAFDAWEQQLAAKGGAPLDANSSLLEGTRVPTVDQQRVLLRNDLGQTFWNGLTITGKIEARGRLLAEIEFPELQPAIVDDISQMAIGHLNKGLLVAHGIDEGGEPDKGIGGHDAMWFVARDLAFGRDAHPDVEPPDNIGRPDAGERLCPEVAPEIESLVSFLANLLIIEFRAEIGFRDTQEVLRTESLFADKRADAEEAAEIVGRIRTDEEIHVRSLCLYLGEMQSVMFKTVDGGTIAGRTLIELFWSGLVRWATEDQPRLMADKQRAEIVERILAHPDGERVLADFDAAG